MGDFCKTYSPNAEEDRELRLLCELQGKGYDKICEDLEKEEKAKKKIDELMKIFEELYELGVTFDRIHEVGVNINGSAYGKLIDDFVQEKPVYLEKYKY